MTETPNLGLPVIVAQQAMKHITHYEALARLDALVQAAVLQININAPPASLQAGDRYLIGATPTGDFAGQAGKLASYDGASWRYISPKAGWFIFNRADSSFSVFDGTSWKRISDTFTQLQNLNGLGIGTTSDSYNRMAVKANAVLFAALASSENGSGDLRFTLNKEAAAKTVSQLYQTNWSGRAETGLMGDDNWRLKVSADGASWRDALVASAATGAVRIDTLVSGRSTPANAGRFECDFDGATTTACVLSDTSTAPSPSALTFRKGGAVVGAIRLAATGTTYLTTSDYRLKQDVQPLSDSLSRFMKLKPCRFAFRAAPEQRVDGFLAHEVADIVPEAVSGARDAVDAEGWISPQALDASKLIPLLVAAVQALAQRIEQIEARA